MIAQSSISGKLGVSIDHIHAPFALFSDSGRYIGATEEYLGMFPKIAEAVEPGQAFPYVLALAAQRKQNVEAFTNPMAWVQNRLATHDSLLDGLSEHMTYAHHFADGRHARVEEYLYNGVIHSTYYDTTDTFSLEAARKELANSEQRAKALASNLSHELRTPLNSILGYADMIAHQIGDIERNTESLTEATQQMNNRLGILLAYSAIEFSSEQAYQLGALIGEAMRAAGSAIDHSTVSVSIAPHRSYAPSFAQPTIRCNTHMPAAIGELIKNAVTFSEACGQVSISTSTDKGGNLLITIKDHGCGMSANDVLCAQSSFGQRDMSWSKTHQGLGMGILYAQKVLETLGGHLEIDSCPGIGTSVYVRIPQSRIS